MTLSLLAFQGPLIIAPAMNDKMWANAAVQQNVAILGKRGVRFVEPDVGHLACGSFGAGRLADVDEIDRVVADALSALS